MLKTLQVRRMLLQRPKTMKPICLDFIKPLLGDYMRNCVLSVPKIKQVIERLMLKFYESTQNISLNLPFSLYFVLRGAATSVADQQNFLASGHTGSTYPTKVSLNSFLQWTFFSVHHDNKNKTQSRTIAEKHTTQSPPSTPGWRALTQALTQADTPPRAPSQTKSLHPPPVGPTTKG